MVRRRHVPALFAVLMTACPAKDNVVDTSDASDASGTEASGESGPSTGTSVDPIACEARQTEDECTDVSIAIPENAGAECAWEADVLAIDDGDECEAGQVVERCVAIPPGGDGGCEQSPCSTTTVLHRDANGITEILAGEYCGVLPVGFQYCTWGSDGALLDGPPSCECACQ